VTIDPSGHFLYTANFQSSNVSMYSIDPGTGALTSLGIDKADAGVFEVAIDPTASFAYVSNSSTGANNLFAYHISASGSLTFVEKVVAGTEPDGLAVDPSGEFVYVANTGSTNVSMYSVDPFLGILTSLTPPTVPSGRNPSHVAVDPSGRFVYVTNSSDPSVSIYTINPDGTLTPLASGKATTGGSPGAIAITGTTQ
jgi:6-phosphogluconolactonase (cycloisomerase 2 family)